MAQTLREFKESVNAQLIEIRSNQDTFRDDMQQLVHTNAVLHSSLGQFERTQSNIENQVQNIATTVTSFARSLSSEPVSSSTVPSEPSAIIPPQVSAGTRTTLPSTTGYYNSTSAPIYQHSTVPTPPNPTTSSASDLPPSTMRQSSPSSLPSNRLPTSKRQKVLFIADSIGRNVDMRHLEEATNSLIYTEKAFGAQYKADAFRPNDNFAYVSMNAPCKRNYKYAVLQGSSTDITNLNTSAVNATNF